MLKGTKVLHPYMNAVTIEADNAAETPVDSIEHSESHSRVYRRPGGRKRARYHIDLADLTTMV